MPIAPILDNEPVVPELLDIAHFIVYLNLEQSFQVQLNQKCMLGEDCLGEIHNPLKTEL